MAVSLRLPNGLRFARRNSAAGRGRAMGLIGQAGMDSQASALCGLSGKEKAPVRVPSKVCADRAFVSGAALERAYEKNTRDVRP